MMADVISFDDARQRLAFVPGRPVSPILMALDALGVALADHGHTWTDRERNLYETAVEYLTVESEADKARAYLVRNVLEVYGATPLPTLLGVCTSRRRSVSINSSLLISF